MNWASKLTVAVIVGFVAAQHAAAQYPAYSAPVPAPTVVYAPPPAAVYNPPAPAGTPFVGSSYAFIPPSYTAGAYRPTTNYYYTAPPPYPPSYYPTTSYYYPSGNCRQSYANPGPYYYTAAREYTPGYYSYYYTPGYFRY